MEPGIKNLVLNLLVLALLVTACGAATSSPAPIATEAVVESNITSTPAVIAAATSAATGQPVQNTDGKVQVRVTEGENWIKSDMTTFKVGVTYVFTVTNTGRRRMSLASHIQPQIQLPMELTLQRQARSCLYHRTNYSPAQL